MSRTYNVIDADGHVLEPFTLWNDYMDPQYRERAPKLVKDKNGKDNSMWIAAAAGMGIGSAALVAALMYANRGKPKKKG